MTNISEEFINRTLVPPTPFSIADCLKGTNFGYIFLYCIISVCFLLGTPANLWCLWLDTCTERKVRQTHVFSLNDTIINFIFCLTCTAEPLCMIVFKNNKYYKVNLFFLCVSWSGRPLIQTCICIEQYLAVLHPVTFLRYKAIKYRIAAVIAVWLMSVGYTVYYFNTMSYRDPVINYLYMFAMFVISFCCVTVLHALKHPGPGDTRNQTGTKRGNQQKRNAFNIIFSAVLLILISYLPQALLSIVTADNTDHIMFICNIAPFMTSFNVFGVLVTPFMKLYKEGHLKCLNYKKKK